MAVELHSAPFDPWQMLAQYQQDHLAVGTYGGTAVFVGTMRDFNEGLDVEGMFLEHYPGMTERELERLVAEHAERHELIDALVHHRVGEIRPGEPIVLAAAWSAHRAAAFEACRGIVEDLKHRAPFWKHEKSEAGDRWVEHNTPG